MTEQGLSSTGTVVVLLGAHSSVPAFLLVQPYIEVKPLSLDLFGSKQCKDRAATLRIKKHCRVVELSN
jgi:hypothetical protein